MMKAKTMRLRNLLCLLSALVALMSGTVWAGDGEEGFWRSVVKENAIEEYELYLGQYPRGKYVEEARRRIEQMKEQAQLEVAQKMYVEFLRAEGCPRLEIAMKTECRFWVQARSARSTNKSAQAARRGELIN